MAEWKFLQDLYHRLNQDHPDEYTDDDIEYMEDRSQQAIIDKVLWYFAGNVPEKVIYPAKSFFVAIVYARLLRDHFNEEPYEVLDDEKLLYGNDPYFEPYSKQRDLYDAVIASIGWDFDLTKGEIPDVANYFYQEFQISDRLASSLSSQ